MKKSILLAAMTLSGLTAHSQFFSQVFDVPGSITNGATYVKGVSDGVVYGYYEATNGYHGFLYSGGAYRNFDVPNANATFILGMSGSNIVGYYSPSNSTYYGYLGFSYNGRSFTTVSIPAAGGNYYDPGTFATGVSGGNIVGYVVDGDDNSFGFLINSNGYTTINEPNAYSSPSHGTVVEGISGQTIVGYYYDSQANTHGFLYDGTNYVTLDEPGDVDTKAFGTDGISVVGTFLEGPGVRGFIYANGVYSSFIDETGAGIGIHPQGVSGSTVVGYFVPYNGGAHGFLAYVSSDLQFAIATNGTGIEITGYLGSATSLIVPSRINELPVTSIGPNAFAESSVTNITLPNTLTSIGDGAFDDTLLTSLTIPAAVTNIGTATLLFGCPNFSTFVVEAGNPDYSAVDGVLFSRDQTILVRFPQAQWTDLDYTVPAGVKMIGNGAFYGCSLQLVILPSGLLDIGDNAFTESPRLWFSAGPAAADIGHIPNTVTNIGSYAFSWLQMTSITIPASVISLGTGALAGCDFVTVCFEGNAPMEGANDSTMFSDDPMQTVFYVAGTAGWGAFFDGVPTAPCQQCGQGNAIGNGDQVILVTNGYGGITHAAWPKNMVAGKKYTVTAAPKPKNLFVNWTGGTSQPYSVLATTANYAFTFEANLVLEANFETNLFLAAQGAYNGLFAPESQPRQQTNSGAFTLNVTGEGSLSGDLYLGSATPIALNGNFAPNGTATVVSKRSGENTLTTTLTLGTSSQTIGGNVTDGSFVAQLIGFQSVFSAKNKAPLAGTYTLVIPGVTNPAEGPYGKSYGTVTVSSSGAISFAGSLADGTPVSRTSTISRDGTWPFYLPLYNGKGSFYSWNSFPNDVTNGTITFSTNGSWINETNSSKTAMYRPGFTNQQAALTGGRYVPANGLPGDLTVTLKGGNLPFVITNSVTITSSDTVVTNSVDDTNKLKLTINKTTGVISGTFVNPSNPKQTIKVNGVILQGQTNAQGYFVGTNQSGEFLLENQ